MGKHFGKVFLLAQEEQVQAQAQLQPVWKQVRVPVSQGGWSISPKPLTSANSLPSLGSLSTTSVKGDTPHKGATLSYHTLLPYQLILQYMSF